jgi:hypothetical protein
MRIRGIAPTSNGSALQAHTNAASESEPLDVTSSHPQEFDQFRTPVESLSESRLPICHLT